MEEGNDREDSEEAACMFPAALRNRAIPEKLITFSKATYHDAKWSPQRFHLSSMLFFLVIDDVLHATSPENTKNFIES